MEKQIRKFSSHQDADQAERLAYLHLSPEERLSLVEILRRRYHKVQHGHQHGFRRVARLLPRPPR